jgi:hypothetical protein
MIWARSSLFLCQLLFTITFGKEEAVEMICDDIMFKILVVSSLDEETMKILTSK